MRFAHDDDEFLAAIRSRLKLSPGNVEWPTGITFLAVTDSPDWHAKAMAEAKRLALNAMPGFRKHVQTDPEFTNRPLRELRDAATSGNPHKMLSPQFFAGQLMLTWNSAAKDFDKNSAIDFLHACVPCSATILDVWIVWSLNPMKSSKVSLKRKSAGILKRVPAGREAPTRVGVESMDNFFSRMKDNARELDRGKAVEAGCHLSFEDPADFLEVIIPARAPAGTCCGKSPPSR